MKIIIPVGEDRGLDSPVHGHFGSAPVFMWVDSETMKLKELRNQDKGHIHGMCNPLDLLRNMQVDAVMCAGMGVRALQRLNRGGVKVFKTSAATVREAIARLVDGSIPEMTSEGACSEHGCH